MSKRATFTEADLRRAIKVAKDNGLTIEGIEVRRDCAFLSTGPAETVDASHAKPEGPRPKEWPDE